MIRNIWFGRTFFVYPCDLINLPSFWSNSRLMPFVWSKGRLVYQIARVNSKGPTKLLEGEWKLDQKRPSLYITLVCIMPWIFIIVLVHYVGKTKSKINLMILIMNTWKPTYELHSYKSLPVYKSCNPLDRILCFILYIWPYKSPMSPTVPVYKRWAFIQSLFIYIRCEIILLVAGHSEGF